MHHRVRNHYSSTIVWKNLCEDKDDAIIASISSSLMISNNEIILTFDLSSGGSNWEEWVFLFVTRSVIDHYCQQMVSHCATDARFTAARAFSQWFEAEVVTDFRKTAAGKNSTPPDIDSMWAKLKKMLEEGVSGANLDPIEAVGTGTRQSMVFWRITKVTSSSHTIPLLWQS